MFLLFVVSHRGSFSWIASWANEITNIQLAVMGTHKPRGKAGGGTHQVAWVAWIVQRATGVRYVSGMYCTVLSVRGFSLVIFGDLTFPFPSLEKELDTLYCTDAQYSTVLNRNGSIVHAVSYSYRYKYNTSRGGNTSLVMVWQQTSIKQ